VEAYASVRLASADLDPLQVTLRLRLPPDHTHRRGEPRLRRTHGGQVREYSPYPHGMWSMSSQPWVHSPRLAVHVEWLLRELEPKAAEVRALIASGVEGDIFCYSRGHSLKPPSIPRRLRERAAALGLEIGIDHYAEGSADPGTRPGDGEPDDSPGGER
jgi:hypothetical protein